MEFRKIKRTVITYEGDDASNASTIGFAGIGEDLKVYSEFPSGKLLQAEKLVSAVESSVCRRGCTFVGDPAACKEPKVVYDGDKLYVVQAQREGVPGMDQAPCSRLPREL